MNGLVEDVVRALLSVVSLLYGSVCFSGSMGCIPSAGGTYTPTQPWPYDTVALEAWASRPCVGSFAGNPCSDVLPRFVGGVVTTDATTINFDMYGSDGSMPPGVPILVTPTPEQYAVSVSLHAGPLASGTYSIVVRVHSIGAHGSDTVCSGSPWPNTVTIRQAQGPVERLTAVEFYNAVLDHYFITVDPNEIADLDNSVHPGWRRTGGSFSVFAPGRSGNTGVPVCRFYGLPSAGLDSHFYTANAAECAQIPAKFKGAWQLETANAFEVWLPTDLGACDVGVAGVARLWNQRIDSNHRFTTDGNVYVDMLKRGYLPEGFGSPVPTAMCSP